MLQTQSIVCGLCMLTLVFLSSSLLLRLGPAWLERKTLIHKRRARRAAGRKGSQTVVNENLSFGLEVGERRDTTWVKFFSVCLLLHSDGPRKTLCCRFAPRFSIDCVNDFELRFSRHCLPANRRCLAANLALQLLGASYRGTHQPSDTTHNGPNSQEIIIL